MTAERWKRIEEIFEAAVERSGGPRAEFLDSACGGDPDLRREVEALLAFDARDEEYFDTTVRGTADMLVRRETESLVGQHLGPYRVTGAIGRGGMSVVYGAVRDDKEYEKQVAIKVVKRGMDSEFVLQRFRQERQILARLEHPFIARLLDGGRTPTGLPYFVMENVEGEPITDYCEARGLTLRERLALVRSVCAAVQYAHQNLVVHGDLKPGNILIAHDGTPRLLDFGLAKLINTDETTYPPPARFMRMLTPNYASPEQVRGETVTTATDVYSLGAVLYEMLARQSVHQLDAQSHRSIEQAVCETEVTPPSHAADPLPGLRGDLDAIVLKALRKPPEERYVSAEQLSQDIRHYLEKYPVDARRKTLPYVFGLFARRNILWIGAAGIVLASLVTGLVVAGVQKHRAEYQAQRAERQFQQVRKLANTVLFELDNKIRALPGSIEAREFLIQTGLDYLDALARESVGQPDLQLELARAYELVGRLQSDSLMPNLGNPPAAMDSFRKGRAILEQITDKDAANPRVLWTRAAVATRIGELSSVPQAFESFQESLALMARIEPSQLEGGQYNTLMNRLYQGLGDAYLRAGDPKGALESFRRAKGPATELRMGNAYVAAGDLTGAYHLWTEFLDSAERRIASGSDSLFNGLIVRLGVARGHIAMANLGNPWGMRLLEPAEALEHQRKAFNLGRALVRQEPRNAAANEVLAASHGVRGAILRDSDSVASVEEFRAAIEIVGKLLESSPGNTQYRRELADYETQISYPLSRLGKRQQALESLHKAQAEESRLGEQTVLTWNETGDLLSDQGDRQGALQAYRSARDAAEKAVAATPRLMPARRDLAECYERLGRFYASSDDCGTAGEWYRKALQVWKEWTAYGVASPYNAREERQVEHLATRCK
jgi:tetratricopeptide (TPR) repeat protein